MTIAQPIKLEGAELMKFTYTEKRMAASHDLKAYAEKKISKIDRLFKTESEAFVTFNSERGQYLAEVTIKNNGMFYRVSELTSDMFASIDSAVAGIERQIRKNKTRLAKRLRDGVMERDIRPVYSSADDEQEEEFKIIRNKKFYISPMCVEEAILQMNLLEHEFFVFRNADDGDAFSVVYKRRREGYGLITDYED